MSCIWMVRQVTWLYHLNTRHPYCPVFSIWYSDGYCIYFVWKRSENRYKNWEIDNEDRRIPLKIFFIFESLLNGKRMLLTWFGMSLFDLRPYIFYKYVFVEYVVLFLNIFSYFMETYDSLSTSKYVPDWNSCLALLPPFASWSLEGGNKGR